VGNAVGTRVPGDVGNAVGGWADGKTGEDGVVGMRDGVGGVGLTGGVESLGNVGLPGIEWAGGTGCGDAPPPGRKRIATVATPAVANPLPSTAICLRRRRIRRPEAMMSSALSRLGGG
jgi:hypothetical protein